MTTEKQVVAKVTQIVSPKKKAFLAAFSECASVSHAAAAAKVSRRQHYRWLKDAEYGQAFKEAKEKGIEGLEREARRRGLEGITRTVWYGGEPVGEEKVYSDTLLIFMLKAARPQVYRERYEVSSPEPEPLVPDPGHSELSNAMLEQLVQMAEQAQLALPAEKNK